MMPSLAGFWGAPTSTVDWCEVNYAVTPFVCEFFNTVSSLAMLGAGVLGVLLHRRVFDRWMLAAFGLLGLVGVGSVAFHGTLRFELQILDELPMLYLVALVAYLLLERQCGKWLPAALLGYAVLATLSDAFTRGQVQFLAFQLTFGALEMFCMFQVYRLSREAENQAVRPLFDLGAGIYFAAIGLWFIDLRFCDVVSIGLPAFGIPNPQFHAWWHVLVSCGFYLLLLVVGYDRLRRRHAQPSYRKWGSLSPSLARG
jgi:dihydroceramidase